MYLNIYIRYMNSVEFLHLGVVEFLHFDIAEFLQRCKFLNIIHVESYALYLQLNFFT